MGGKRKSGDLTELPAGIEVRYWANGNSALRVHFQYRGVRCREPLNLPATPSNIKFAINLRYEIKSAIARGTFNYTTYFPNSKNARKFGYKPPSNITIGEMLNQYLEQVKRTLEVSTYDGYYKKTYRYLMPAFKDIPMRGLTAAMIREWVKEFKLTTKTIQNALTPLRAVIAIALIDEIIDKNPLDHIILSKLVNKETSESDYEVDPFDKKEIEAILKTAKDQVKNLFQFAFFTGLRTSELIALEWGDIDWIHGQVHVDRAFVSGVIKKTKTKAGKRQVLLLPPALEALKAQKLYTFMEGKRVFHASFSNQPWSSPFQIRHSAWAPLLRRAGVRYRNPYQTRHTYASMMLSSGENIMWVAKQMGHANIETVIKVYGRWIPDSSVSGGYKPVNNWGRHLQLKEEFCPVYVPQTLKNEVFEEKILINQIVNLASPRGFEPLLPP
jgi:integrase